MKVFIVVIVVILASCAPQQPNMQFREAMRAFGPIEVHRDNDTWIDVACNKLRNIGNMEHAFVLANTSVITDEDWKDAGLSREKARERQRSRVVDFTADVTNLLRATQDRRMKIGTSRVNQCELSEMTDDEIVDVVIGVMVRARVTLLDTKAISFTDAVKAVLANRFKRLAGNNHELVPMVSDAMEAGFTPHELGFDVNSWSQIADLVVRHRRLFKK